MIEFKIETYRKKINIPDKVGQCFKAPIIFYLFHEDDKKFLFPTFVIADLKNKELAYIISFSPENQKKLNGSEHFLKHENYFDVHSSLEIRPHEQFFTFTDGGYYFFYVDYRKGIMRMVLNNDILGLKNSGAGVDGAEINPIKGTENNYIQELGATFFKDDQDQSFFYFSTKEKVRGKETVFNNFYKADLYLKGIESVFRGEVNKNAGPMHTTRKFKNLIYCADFPNAVYKIDSSGILFNSQEGLTEYIYNDLYNKFCQKKNEEYSKEKFAEEVKIDRCDCSLSERFDDFCRQRGKDVFDIGRKNKEYAFSALPGTFFTIDLEKMIKSEYATTCCEPAHFEIDPIGDCVYVSSHNFMKTEKKVNYFGPAAIDKFLINGDKLERVGTFTDPRGHRFTTHRIFYYNNKPFFCTFGYPNRLFFVDAKTMKEHHHADLIKDILSCQDKPTDFLNGNDVTNLSFTTMEVSAGGEYIFILGGKNIYFYNFPEKKFEGSVSFISDEIIASGIPVANDRIKTTHTNYLI